ncbi:MAG TPA: MFS transporter [Burkholderiaceae bacterium]|nr:MFS transporter [Burkholderiaceae bacterium]
MTAGAASTDLIDSRYAWTRLAAAVVLAAFGGVGMWSVVVALPTVQAEFGLARGEASVPYTLTMVGFALGGVMMGRLADQHGIFVPLLVGTLGLALGYVMAGTAGSFAQFALAHCVLIAFAGSSAMFGPLIADSSLWFVRRRGMAVAICAAGNYVAGTIWPPIVQHFIETAGWRATHVGIGIACLVGMLPLVLVLRRRAPRIKLAAAPGASNRGAVPLRPQDLGVSSFALQSLLVLAAIACCVAMSMPQVHIVAYCADLGYGAARGAEMLSLMLGCGIVSRLASGWIADRIGGLATLLLGSVLQGVALLLFVPFDGLTSLYVIAALFGLFQGGIVPSYAIIVREYFSPFEAGMRVGTVLMASLGGMALGGWLSGVVFDLTGSYRAAFVNGIGWNLLNVSIVLWLLRRRHAAQLAGTRERKNGPAAIADRPLASPGD